MRIIQYNKSNYGILYKDAIFDITTLKQIQVDSYRRPAKGHLNTTFITKEHIKKFRKKFPFTNMNDKIIFHINLTQSMWVHNNIFYAAYPQDVLTQLIKFIELC